MSEPAGTRPSEGAAGAPERQRPEAPPPEKPAKAKAPDEGPDPDAWMVTFSDLLNLLMTFFVLIFATQDPVKEKLQEAFGQQSGVFGLFRRSFLEEVTAVPRVEVSQDRLQVLLDEVGAPDIEVTQEERGLVVTLPTDAYFEPGSTRLDQRALGRIAVLSQYLRYSSHQIRVEGHTDNREYQTYPSGWELSLARAHSVLDALRARGIPEGRLSLVGYGPSRPRFDNSSRVGRARNRRVEIVITGRFESP
jgi:chemotaxis protein MotB